jgi:hypothetical protein
VANTFVKQTHGKKRHLGYGDAAFHLTLKIQFRSRLRFPALPDFLRSSGSGSGPLSLVSTIEEPLGRNSSGSGLENREYGRGDPLR